MVWLQSFRREEDDEVGGYVDRFIPAAFTIVGGSGRYDPDD